MYIFDANMTNLTLFPYFATYHQDRKRLSLYSFYPFGYMGMQHIILFGFTTAIKWCIIQIGYVMVDRTTSYIKQKFEASEIAAHSHCLTSQQQLCVLARNEWMFSSQDQRTLRVICNRQCHNKEAGTAKDAES